MLPRRFTEADAGPLAALYGDPRVMRFITLQPPSLAKVESEILPEYLREYRYLTDGLYPAFWGRGLATEGSRPLIASAFGRLRRVRTFYYPDADLMPGAEHGDVVYELTRSDWARLVNPAETEDRRPGHTS
jgi:RimJ/RimL family protein N-acetyltransferase